MPADPARAPAGLSVFFPAYNDSGTIASMVIRAVQAASEVTPDFEVIVVNDGSSDATAEIALSHASADPRIRLVRQANSGVAAARNAGVRLARGELVAPIDADDLWAPTKIERQVAALASPGAVAECTEMERFFRENAPDRTTARLAYAAWLGERAAEFHADPTRPDRSTTR